MEKITLLIHLSKSSRNALCMLQAMSLYSCSHCKSGDKVQKEMIYHLYKYHVKLESAPFYCGLCLFRCTTATELASHTKGYTGHITRVKAMIKAGIELNENDYLREAITPRFWVEGTDYVLKGTGPR